MTKDCPPGLAAPEPEMIDIRGVADVMAVSVDHVRRLAAAGLMPRPAKLGRILRWHRPTISAWLANGCPPQA